MAPTVFLRVVGIKLNREVVNLGKAQAAGIMASPKAVGESVVMRMHEMRGPK